MDYLIVSGLIAEVSILSWVDRRVFGTWFTPFNLLGYPYMVVVVSAFLFAPPLGFVPVYTRSILIWMVGLLVFWSVGSIIGLIFDLRSGPNSANIAVRASSSNEAAAEVATKIAWVIMPLMALGLYKSQAIAGGWHMIGSYDFKAAYVHGLPGHAVQLAQPLSVLLLGTYKKGRRLQLFAIVGLLFFLFCTQVK